MALLFGKAKSTINEHIQNIFKECELDEALCTQKFGISEFQQKAHNYYNLDVIISVGYRVKSMRGTQFRQWATKRLNEYIRKGFTMDDERLKNLGGGGFWKELLQRICDIRAIIPIHLQAHCQSCTSQRYNQNFVNEFVKPARVNAFLK